MNARQGFVGQRVARREDGRFLTGREVAETGIARLIDLLGSDLETQIAAYGPPESP